jgi:hypothetical protein
MAPLSNLVSVLAHVTGLPEATVFAYGRFAREAGLISQAGRGLGGAQMTASDATNLLFAVCGSRVTRDAGKAIAALRSLSGKIMESSLREIPPELKEWSQRYNSFSLEQSGEPQLRLGVFVDYLIYEACTGKLEALVRSLKIYDVPRLIVYPNPELEEAIETFHKNKLLLPVKKPDAIDLFDDVDLGLSFNSTLDHAFFEIKSNFLLGNDSLAIEFGQINFPPKGGDLSTESSVSQRTIFAIGDCLGPVPKIEIPQNFSPNGDRPSQAESERSGKRRPNNRRAS